jgi:hypothetical protein
VNVPGVNVLGLALSVLSPQMVKFYAWTGTTTSGSGKETPAYAAPVLRRGALQPVNRSNIQNMGLEMSKSYMTFFGPGAVRTLERDGSPDAFGYAGRRYNALSLVDWQAQDGWTAALCVDVGPDA